MKKYKLTDEFVTNGDGTKLYRIQALKDFGGVKKGDLGGFIENEDNLSHHGNAWVSDNARVSGNAFVNGNAEIFGNAQVSGNARVCGYALVYGRAEVRDHAQVHGNAKLYGDAEVSTYAQVNGRAFINDKSQVFSANNVGSENRTLTVFTGINGLLVTRGCFTGTVDEFLEKSKNVHDYVTHHEYQLLIEVAKSRIKKPFYLRNRG